LFGSKGYEPIDYFDEVLDCMGQNLSQESKVLMESIVSDVD